MCQSEYEGKQKYKLSCIAQGTGQSIRRHRVKQKGSVGRTVDIELVEKTTTCFHGRGMDLLKRGKEKLSENRKKKVISNLVRKLKVINNFEINKVWLL